MKRLQRLRATAALRDMVSEIGFGQSQLIQPLFLSEGATQEEPIAGLAEIVHEGAIARLQRLGATPVEGDPAREPGPVGVVESPASVDSDAGSLSRTDSDQTEITPALAVSALAAIFIPVRRWACRRTTLIGTLDVPAE